MKRGASEYITKEHGTLENRDAAADPHPDGNPPPPHRGPAGKGDPRMIAELGRHAAPVLAAWSISGVLIVGLIAQTLVAASRARRALEKVERRG